MEDLSPAALHGFGAQLTTFIGRDREAEELTGLLGQYRLVTVTGPGGVGKTRLAAEVARRACDRFADGAWLVELASVAEPAQVLDHVATAVGVPRAPGVVPSDALRAVLARQQALLVFDNCEQVADAVAELCQALILTADDVRVLATSREPIGLAAEARYRLAPMALTDSADLSDICECEAVLLFADRARRVDSRFALTSETAPAVARLVRQLDGVPLAIELAASRVESLGVSQLLDRLDDRFALLTASDRMAAQRHQSMAAAVDWSYRMLSAAAQQAFRKLTIFPGPFTLAAAQAVAGDGAESHVLRLVDCSLLTPPRGGADGHPRYAMLSPLRAYGSERLAEAGEQPEAAAALVGYALHLAEHAAAQLERSPEELTAAHRLDCEDASTHQGLSWAQEHDPQAAVRLAVALAPWWQLRGRAAVGYDLLRLIAGQVAGQDDAWRECQLSLGHLAYSIHDHIHALTHYEAVLATVSSEETSPATAAALAGRASVLRNLSRMQEAEQDAQRALGMSRQLGYPAGEVLALTELALTAHHAGDHQSPLDLARRACWIDPDLIPGAVVRRREYVLMIALTDAGQESAARQSCQAGLSRARAAGDVRSQATFLGAMVQLALRAGELASAGEHLREAIEIGLRCGDHPRVIECLAECGNLCAAARQWKDAVTMWSASSACLQAHSRGLLPADEYGVTRVHVKSPDWDDEALAALGQAAMTAAEDRGMLMTLDTAAELAVMLCSGPSSDPSPPPRTAQLSARERELVALVAKGMTDAQIAGHLYISIRTVSSHLDRIRDKTGCRRRADLTRLALQAGLA